MRRAATTLGLALVALAATGLDGAGVSGSGSELRAFRSDRYALEGRLPLGWKRADARLVPLLIPREVLSVGTFPMPVGGGGNCGREPVAAIRRMRPGDALISIQEYQVTAPMRHDLTTIFPPKSEQLDLEGLRFGRVAARRGDRRDPGVAVTWGTIPFSEAGRAFDALVYFRGRPGIEERRAAAQVIAELDFEKLPFEMRPSDRS